MLCLWEHFLTFCSLYTWLKPTDYTILSGSKPDLHVVLEAAQWMSWLLALVVGNIHNLCMEGCNSSTTPILYTRWNRSLRLPILRHVIGNKCVAPDSSARLFLKELRYLTLYRPTEACPHDKAVVERLSSIHNSMRAPQKP